jgi:NAD(P) transhydrogenase
LIEPNDLFGVPTGAFSKILRKCVLAGVESWDQVGEIAGESVGRALEMVGSQLDIFHVQLLKGKATFADEHTVKFCPNEGEPRILNTDAVFISTGSHAFRPPGVDFDIPEVFDSDTIATINWIPQHIVVQGGGIIGIEFGSILGQAGTKITVIERSSKILTRLEPDIADAFLEDLRSKGAEILLDTTIDSIERLGEKKLRIKCGQRTFHCDAFLSGAGRHGVVEGYDLQKIKGIKKNTVDRISCDNNFYTGIEKIYALGDVAEQNPDHFMLACGAQLSGRRAAETCFGQFGDRRSIGRPPATVWSIPECGWCGISTQQARSTGMYVNTVRVEYGETTRGCVSGDKGFLKLIYKVDSMQVVGVHIYGDMSTEIINYGAECVAQHRTIRDIMNSIFPAVTYHELYQRAAQFGMMQVKQVKVKSVSARGLWNRAIKAVQNHINANKKSGIVPQSWTLSKELKAGLKRFDQSQKGSLDAVALGEMLKFYGQNVPPEQLGEMVAEADIVGDDVLHLAELVMIMNC